MKISFISVAIAATILTLSCQQPQSSSGANADSSPRAAGTLKQLTTYAEVQSYLTNDMLRQVTFYFRTESTSPGRRWMWLKELNRGLSFEVAGNWDWSQSCGWNLIRTGFVPGDDLRLKTVAYFEKSISDANNRFSLYDTSRNAPGWDRDEPTFTLIEAGNGTFALKGRLSGLYIEGSPTHWNMRLANNYTQNSGARWTIWVQQP